METLPLPAGHHDIVEFDSAAKEKENENPREVNSPKSNGLGSRLQNGASRNE